jgi:hypothetical protein
MAPTALCWGLGLFFRFFIFCTVGRTSWAGDQPVARPLSVHRIAQTQNKRTQTSTPWVGFEPMIPVSQRVKTMHALGRPATVLGITYVPLFVLVRSLTHVFKLSNTVLDVDLSQCQINGNKIFGTCSANEWMISYYKIPDEPPRKETTSNISELTDG